MAFYRNRYSPEDAAPLLQKVREHLTKYGKRMINDDDPDRFEWFFYPKGLPVAFYQELNKYTLYLQIGGFLKVMPTENGTFVLLGQNGEERTPTTSPTHLRLPKLPHLLTLTPTDFFLLMRLITTAKATPYGPLKLNFPAVGIKNFSNHVLTPYFSVLKVNYNFNPTYADVRWTSKELITKVATLPPTRENQLLAIQLIVAGQYDDLLYFPLDSMLDLELEWEQISNDYCVPRGGEN